MPFTPLPPTFTADLERAGAHRVLELGSGDGRFTELLRQCGVSSVTLDRGAPVTGTRAAIRGDVLVPPLRGRFDVVVAANLLRHVWSRLPGAGPTAWRDLVASGGSLWILEDEPVDTPPPARHYRDLQGLLARLEPAGRGPLLAHRRFAARCRAWDWPGRWAAGGADNDWTVSAAAVADWLAGGVVEPGGEVDRLARAIRADGLSYGRYWWACWRAEDAT